MTDDSDAKQSEDINTEYANNTFFESTIWDLKILFGEYSARSNAVDWHTSITLPWAAAKLMAFYLSVNVVAQELRSGRIKVPNSVLPPEPPPPTDAEKASDPFAEKLYQTFMNMRKNFIEGAVGPE